MLPLVQVQEKVRDGHHIFNFAEGASWQTSLPPDIDYNHPIFTVRGFTLWSIAFDWLHVADLGVASHALANVVWDIVVKDTIGNPTARDQKFAEVADFLLQYTPTGGSKLTQVALNNFCDPDALTTSYPLCAHLKAAEVRGMVPAVLELRKQHNDGSRWRRHQIRMLEHLNTCYETIHTGGIVLADSEKKQLKTSAKCFLEEYTFLSAVAARDGHTLFNVVPKFHYFWHMCVQQGQHLNPRFVWCYSGEDLVGKASRLAHACCKGTANFKVPAKLMAKYRLAQHLKWSRC